MAMFVQVFGWNRYNFVSWALHIGGGLPQGNQNTATQTWRSGWTAAGGFRWPGDHWIRTGFHSNGGVTTHMMQQNWFVRENDWRRASAGSIAVYIDTISTPHPRWGWRAYPNSDINIRPYYINATTSRVWIPHGEQGSLFRETKPSYGTLYEGLGELFGGLREMAWHQGSPPSTNFPFSTFNRVSRRGSDAFWGVMYIYDWNPPISSHFPTHVWMELLYESNPIPWPPARDFTYWVRGAGDLSWPTHLRNTPIDDAVFPPRSVGMRRLSLAWYHRPWERYPHLIL